MSALEWIGYGLSVWFGISYGGFFVYVLIRKAHMRRHGIGVRQDEADEQAACLLQNDPDQRGRRADTFIVGQHEKPYLRLVG